AAAVVDARSLDHLHAGHRFGVDGVHQRARPARAAAGTPAHSASRTYPWPRRGGGTNRDRLATAGRRCVFPSRRNGPRDAPLHAGPGVLPMDAGKGPGSAPVQPAAAARAASRAWRRRRTLLLARRRRVRAHGATFGTNSGRRVRCSVIAFPWSRRSRARRRPAAPDPATKRSPAISLGNEGPAVAGLSVRLRRSQCAVFGLRNLYANWSVWPRIDLSNTFTLCVSFGLRSTPLSPTYSNPAAVTCCFTVAGSMRCSVSVSRRPEPASATWSTTM